MEGKVTEDGQLVDPKIYRKAAQRTRCKCHIAIYVLSMLILWVLYLFLFRATEPTTAEEVVNGGMTFLKFIILVTALWTIIVVFHVLFVYKFNNSMIDKEIKQLQEEIEAKKALRDELKEENRN